MLNTLTPINELGRLGKSIAPTLKKLGLETVRDLLFYYPRRYLDYRSIQKLNAVRFGEDITVRGTIELIENRRSWKRHIVVTTALFRDDTGSGRAVWFGQAHIGKILHAGDHVLISGKAEHTRSGPIFKSPSWEKDDTDSPTHAGRLVPLYRLTASLSQKQIRTLIRIALPALRGVRDPLPDSIRNPERFLTLSHALASIHFPQSMQAKEAAAQRLKFDELFFIELATLGAKQKTRLLSSPPIPFDEQRTKRFVASLPFQLTEAQRKAAWEIIRDLKLPHPANRLLDGDVGSGKTVVAALAMVNVAAAKYQSVLMAPTEILAEQHFRTLTGLLKSCHIRVGLLTGSRNEDSALSKGGTRRALLASVRAGEIDVLVGTHALLSRPVQFARLALSVIDEQHRFGVNQRARLKEKGGTDVFPHLLSMTATPIPRTLSLTLYGDLDLTILDELPAGRKPVRTEFVPPLERKRAYALINEELRKGQQAFVICPLVEESEKLQVKAAETEWKRLSKEVFPRVPIGLIHGRMNTEKKEKAMRDFLDGSTKILVATPVVEVGVDIPNATVMVVEAAERFGLASLHQFRGRVGRAHAQSYCFLFAEKLPESSAQRLTSFINAQDGFALAEADLSQRGPGEFLGTRQSGFDDVLKIASLTDYALIKKARGYATTILAQDPLLASHPLLKDQLEAFSKLAHFE